MKTENNVMVPFNSILLRTSCKKKCHEHQKLSTNNLTLLIIN